MVSSSIRLTADCKFKEAGRNGQRLMYESLAAIISALVICIIVCLSWAVNHYRDAYSEPSATKMPELKLANAAITDMQMRQRDVAALDANTKSQLMLKLKMMLCVMMLPLVVVGCTSKQSVSQCVTTPPAWIITASTNWQTPLSRIISPSES